MNIPSHFLYSKTDEWVSVEGDIATIGITESAQSELGDIGFMKLPEVGSTVTVEEMFGAVESAKSASDLIAPVSGVVVDTNSSLEQVLEMINTDPYGSWMIKVKLTDMTQLSALMDSAAYEAYLVERR